MKSCKKYTVPCAYGKKEWHMFRLKTGEVEAKEELVAVEHPYMSLTGVLADGQIYTFVLKQFDKEI